MIAGGLIAMFIMGIISLIIGILLRARMIRGERTNNCYPLL